MRKKINAQFLLITAVEIILTVFLSVFVCYNLFQEEVISSLRTYAHVIKSSGIFDEQSDASLQDDAVEGLRITLIDEDGTVVFDSNADIGQMDNHGQRPEIQSALENGEAEIVRRSDTLDKNTYYYAIRLDDGRILRVAKEAGSVWSFLLPLIPVLLFMGMALFLVCLVLAHFLTKSIISPIEDMAQHMDDEEYEIAYKEMKPFLDMIQKQHSDIVKSSQMRQEFTANVSHELKTPLTAISGYSELIESGIATKEDTVRFSAEIHKSSNRLLMLINDILRLSELDSSEDVLVKETVDLYELAEKCVDMMQVNAEKHHVTLRLAGGSCFIQANREMIEEVMYNLCSNAIRYNVPDGSVVMTVGMEGNHAVLTVEDTGIGIPEEDQKRIFERFYRVDKSRSKSTGGTGLGLAIVKHAVAKHGAEIGLWSKTGVGTRMRVVFPESK
ncbi:ATPase/histidine kinase/DNA gyrase B/HSP90 domain protein [Marvinbryantia formatexigens DSM 14469]|uniref:histidine kinase n=1 Tax=Marvinbryantia formatexigens DSM 14469 TaxID=478749 RepID=C6LAV2_9FIRM|nr:ATP-binding protein [Marvinbryantia formatexigens]EET62083.1 ATPase/histidine kinase/DNA gyrase B/HSP90 domain protein [Marvinbryantia formatexigens DSM 14469]UWO26554.1 ATP-binding protein [Marvinbryantia formatexigens DSM 14469]SDF76273.1 two-component system, OmpR family, phosphate regulon sensor histidine kinase PhoR [Marvinbryantia formatexigens]